ncbi:uncharacterized protein OCT59_006332 [Rhizophagus irregularis]|nr:hypothetical protein OCT59_006332 [Rhizophagus irregularis]
MSKISNNLETLISEGCIEYYEYSDFKNIQLIGKGASGSVTRATWKDTTTRFFALKSFNNDKQTHKEIVKELTLHRKVDIHENILRFYGISSVEPDEMNQMKKYYLVLEYADSDTLNTYLNNHFDELNWNDKLRLAFQLTSAVECIHCCGIIHRDLHAKNILIHQKSIKLADFGLSKKISEESSNAKKVFGVVPYIDPKSLDDQKYKLNEKSDIYGIGVLMWQISSGRQPFKDKGFDYDVQLSIAIINGLREEIIDKTPVEYSNLYKECWKNEPNNRPNIQKVVLTLKAIISPKQDNTINENFSEESVIDSSEKYQTISDIIPDINEDLSIDSNIGVNSSNDFSNDKPDISTQRNSAQLINIVDSKKSESSSSNALNKRINPSCRNAIELALEEDGFTTLDEKAKELIKKLTETKYLQALKLLIENLQNEFTPQILRDTLVALADPTSFDYYAKQSVARLELHLRTWAEVLERVCFSPMCLSKELQDKIHNSLTKFAEIYHKTTQIMEEGFENNNFNLNFDQQNDDDCETITKNRNYNIEFLLIHLRDTLNSLRDDETWFQEIIRKTRELLKVVVNIVPGILTATSENTTLNNSCSILSMLTQLRQGLSFKYPVATYYIDWRIMLIIQYNLLNWTDSSEKIFNKKFGEMLLMEYIWGFLEKEWINTAEKSILSSQMKFDELSNKLVKSFKNTGSFSNKPFSLPHTLWFGILDIAQNLILRSTHTAIHGLGYYLAIESLNKAPSSFIQFKAVEILLHLYNINNELFSIIEIDFDQYVQKLKKNNLETDHFQNLLLFMKEICLEDFDILNKSAKINKEKEEKGKEKEKILDQNLYLKKDQLSNYTILETIADEMTCPVSSEPTDQLCILKCQHILSLDNFKKLKQKNCPKCREKIDDIDIRYIPQSTIYKNLYSYLFEAGYILPLIESEDTHNQCNSDSDNSEFDTMLIKKKRFRLNSSISLQSFFPKISKKQHPMYQNAIKELNENNYEKTEYYCKEFLKIFPTNYIIRCILAYTYRCLNNYELAHLYLKEAIRLKKKKPIAYFICGELFFRQSNYDKAIYNLNKSLEYKTKISNLYIILGNSYIYKAESCNYNNYNNYYYYLSEALKNYNTALQNNPYNYLCLKTSAFIYEKQEYYSNALKIYGKAISYFTKANIIDPNNVHYLNKRSMAYFAFQDDDKYLLDFKKTIQLDPLNSIAYYYKILIYMIRLNNIYYDGQSFLTNYSIEKKENITETIVKFEKCIELDHDFWLKLCKIYEMEEYNFNYLGIINKINEYMYKVHRVYFISNLVNLDDTYHQFEESNSNSLTGYVLSFKNEESLSLGLPKFSTIFESFKCYWIIWKININKLSANCFINFVIKKFDYLDMMHKQKLVLTYNDLSKYEKLGWVEFKLPYELDNIWINGIQVSIEIEGLVDMQIDYIRFIPYKQTKTSNILSGHKVYLNVPEIFKDKYFSRKEMENLLELKDIIG